jgi:hypothetical protein
MIPVTGIMARAITTLRVPTAAYAGLAHIAENPRAVQVLKDVARVGASTPEIADDLASHAGISGDAAREILSQLAGLHGTRETLDAAPEEIFDAITRSLEQEAPQEWRDKYLQGWKEARAHVVDALAPGHPLAVVNKTTRLTFAHQNILRGARLITDVRPVFDEKGDQIVQSVVTHSLALDYSVGSELRSLHVTLDAADLKKLCVSCERAEHKARTLKKSFGASGLAIVVAGEDPDDSSS